MLESRIWRRALVVESHGRYHGGAAVVQLHRSAEKRVQFKRITIDFEPILEGELYGPLRDAATFAQVTLDPEVHTVVWPCGADFDPATLHDWPEHEAAFRAAAERWSLNAIRG